MHAANRKYTTILIIILTSILLITIFTPYVNPEAFNDDIDEDDDTVDNENIIYCFWTGENKMSEKRLESYDGLRKHSKCKVMLITPENLNEYILPDHPLHEAYSFLSLTHRADYLRTYFMHFHGGGYSDVKDTRSSWKKAFQDVHNHPDIYINGYRELQSGDIAYPPVAHMYDKLVGNGAYIVKPNTEFTNRWYTEMISVLDTKLPFLKRMKSTPKPSEIQESDYPIGWNEILGRIFHKVLADYIDKNKILYTVPYPIISDYR